ncbi:MAG: hypothetical protein AB7V13_25190 [Pseudorhodoplanes sp.]|uniref:hypothetical protein n=1 Tax=Pseudorhodoplanes sp. TaxID=1934341 RepID=UPI003D0ADDB3
MLNATPRECSLGSLNGLRVLALLPSKRAGFRYALAPLEYAKAQLGWQINIASHGEKNDYSDLAAPAGLIFRRPDIETLPEGEWEKDPDAVADLERRLWQAELAAGVPVGQLLLAGELSVGHGFAYPVLRLRENDTARRVLHDTGLALKIFQRLFAIADDVLAKSRADVVYTLDAIDPFRSALWLAAQGRGIPCIALRKSKMRSDHFYFTTDRLLYNVLGLQRSKERQQARTPISEAAKAHIQQFLAGPRIVKYQERKKAKRSSINWFTLHYRLLKKTVKEPARRMSKGFSNSLVRYNRPLISGPLQRGYLRRLEEAELAEMKYIYFPLHKEADIPLIFQASPWFDQRHTAGLLASHLPAGYKLIVREHRSNFGYRPASYYRDLAKLPNIVLVDGEDSQFKYLRNADLIVTENGSSGWEGLLYGRRVLTLDCTFYDGVGLPIRVETPRQLGPMILQSLSRPAVADQAAHEASLGYMIDGEYDTTFSMNFDSAEDIARLWNAFSILIAAGSADAGLGIWKHGSA